jgi:hypothetical protein
MSTSTKSKPASERSPETGAGTEGETPRAGSPLEVELEVSRQHAAGWTVFGLLFGGLLVWKLGTVGVWVGVVLMVIGVFRAYELLQTYRHPPGTIIVSEKRVVLPRGLCVGRPVEVSPSAVTAVYFLRRSVPWNRSAPVLVVEVGGRAMAFPRDWFATEADQRRIVHALLGTMKTSDSPGTESAGAAIDAANKLVWVQAGAGLVLLGTGIAGAMASSGGPGGNYAVYVAPMVGGFILCWRALTRW